MRIVLIQWQPPNTKFILRAAEFDRIRVSPVAGLFGEEGGDHFSSSSSSSPALDMSVTGCWDDNIDDIPPMGSVFFAAAAEVDAASGGLAFSVSFYK